MAATAHVDPIANRYEGIELPAMPALANRINIAVADRRTTTQRQDEHALDLFGGREGDGKVPYKLISSDRPMEPEVMLREALSAPRAVGRD